VLPLRVLVIDIGGSHVKLAVPDEVPRRFDSGEHLTPALLVRDVKRITRDWDYDAISIGYPGAVDATGPADEPGNLGDGWVGFEFDAALGKPVRIVNDAAMQALGGYDGGRMLFLGLGTGLGSTLVTERVIVPLELGCLPFEDATLFDLLGRDALERRGQHAWQRTLTAATCVLRDAFLADYIVLGGGNAERVDPIPPHARRGGNDDAFAGGWRLWEDIVEPHDQAPARVWRVVR
jgi:polyphosphate glucokinase